MCSERKLRAYSVFVFLVLFSAARIGVAQDVSQSDQKPTPHELMVHYAKTNLELAKVELKQAELMNQDGLAHVPTMAIERFRSNLAIAEEQNKQASLASTGGPEQVRLRHAEERVRMAKLAFERGTGLRKKGSISELDLKVRKLKHELALLRLAMLKNPRSFVTLMDSMERRLDRFGEEILTLDLRIARLESNR